MERGHVSLKRNRASFYILVLWKKDITCLGVSLIQFQLGVLDILSTELVLLEEKGTKIKERENLKIP